MSKISHYIILLFSSFGWSAGCGVSVVAETTTGCLISADATVSYPNVDEMSEQSEKPEIMSPEDLGEQVASMLLEEVAQGGVVDSTHQVWYFIPVYSFLILFSRLVADIFILWLIICVLFTCLSYDS